MDNIMKYCQQKKCSQTIEYNKLVTSGNNPSISKRMRYSQYVNNTNPNKIYYPQYVIQYGIPQPPVAPPQSTRTEFNTFYF